MIWYCTMQGSFIVSQNIEGLLIRGISEQSIFEVEANNKWEASTKASEIIEAEASQKGLINKEYK